MQAEYAPIPALERAAQVLQVVLESPSGLPAKHIAAACPAVPKTSFYRLLSALVASGFLMFDAQRSVYCAGELFTRAYESQDQRLQVLLRVAQPHLEQLAQAVKESEVYREYRRQSERVDNAGDMREKIDEYRVRNFELQNSVQTEDLLDKLDDFEREYEKFREDPLVEEFLDAELAFCRMMQEIDVKLAEAMDFE